MIGGGKGAAVEGLTEGVQEANNLIAAQLLKDNPEFFTQENVDRILDAGLRGAIGGKAFGMVSGIPGESPQQRESREKAETQQQLRDDIQTVRTDIEQGGQEVIARSMPDPDVPLLAVPESEQVLNKPVYTTIDRSGDPVLLSGKELIEFAENNRNVDPQIPSFSTKFLTQYERCSCFALGLGRFTPGLSTLVRPPGCVPGSPTRKSSKDVRQKPPPVAARVAARERLRRCCQKKDSFVPSKLYSPLALRLKG